MLCYVMLCYCINYIKTLVRVTTLHLIEGGSNRAWLHRVGLFHFFCGKISRFALGRIQLLSNLIRKFDWTPFWVMVEIWLFVGNDLVKSRYYTDPQYPASIHR